MRKILFRTTAFLVLALAAALPAYAQTIEEKIEDLYHVSVGFPEGFDSSYALLTALNDEDEVVACLEAIGQYYWQIGQAWEQQCRDAHGGFGPDYWECIRNNSNTSLAFWARDSIYVLRTSNASWLDTATGRNMHNAKQTTNMLMPGSWEAGIEYAMPAVRQMLVCN